MPESLTFCGRTFGRDELELMRGIAAEFSTLGVTEIARTVCELLDWKRPNGGLKNHECRQLLERLAAERELTLTRSAEAGREGPAPRRRIRTILPSRAYRVCRERVRASGVDPGGRQIGEPAVARADGTSSLSRMPRPVRRKLTLLGAEWQPGTGLSALDVTRLEDAGPRRLDRVERSAAATQSAIDRQQWPIPHPAMGASHRTGQQNSGAECTDRATRLGGAIWAASAAIGNTGGRGPLSRNLLSGRQLDPCWADHWARAYGSRAPKTRCCFQRYLHLSADPRCPTPFM
jgi:hypothetical protein